MKQLLLSITLIFVLIKTTLAQEPPDQCPGGNIVLASTCQDACVLCDINGLVGNNSLTVLGQAPPGFCAPQLHNTQWVGFIAGSTNIQMQIMPFGCLDGEGLQIGIYNTLDCTSFSLVSQCYDDIDPNEVSVYNMFNLQVGGIYFIVIDGSNGDICNFSIDVTQGSTVAPQVTQASNFPIPAGSPFCIGETLNVNATTSQFASIYTWTLNGNEVAYTQSAEITIPTGTPSGTAQLCVTPSNPCSQGVPFCRTITISPPDMLTASATICQGQSYTFEGEIFFNPGSYIVNATGPDGCLDIYTFTLNVLPPQFSSTSDEICEGEIYWVGTPNAPGSQALVAQGIYSITIPTINGGCDSTVNVNLTVHPNTLELLQESICQGESITVGGQTFTQTGFYEIIGMTPQGCISTTLLNLTVYPVPAPVTINATICNEDNYSLGNSIFLTQPGFYQFIQESVGGCDSIININLTRRAPIATNIVQTICAGQSVTIGNGPPITTSGNYTRVLTSLTTGCDSTVNLNLTVRAPIVSTINAIICQGESYTIGGTAFTTQGTHQRVVTSLTTGCDSTITLNLTVRPNRFTTLTETICSDETYSVGNSTYDASGTYQDTLMAANGCDSVITLNLTVLGAITGTSDVTICDGETYSLGGNTFDTDGTYQVSLTSVNGCDSVVTLNLEVLEILATTFNEDICQGEILTFNGNPYSASGQYVETFVSSNGCDSIVTLNLNVIQPLTTLLNIGICTGQTYTVGANTYDAAGTYVNTLVAASGCDSIVTLNLTVDDLLEGFGAVEICDGDVYSAGGMDFTTTGLYDIPSVTPSGCDSVFHLDLTVHPIPVTNLVESICDDENFTVGNSTYTTTGIYQNTLTSLVTGCDSIVNLNLTVLNTPDVTLNISICDGESYTVGTTPYTTAGSYQQTFTAANGCDSTVSLNLTILNVPVTDLVESICDGETYTVGTSNYTTTGVYQDVLVAANGCDSIVNLNLTVLDVPETNLTELICDGETYSVGTSIYTVSGVYQDILVAANGCDSIVNLNLTVAPNPVTNIVTSICDGATYQVGNSSYTATGMYSDTLTSSVGCDSIVNLNLTITSFYQINLVESICEGETFTVGTTVYDETGMYSNMFIAQDGCDSFVNLNLTVLLVPITDLVETICDGETYTVGTSDYTGSGVYQDILVAANGCDSIVNLNLTVNPVFTTDLTEFICDGESYPVGNSNYTVSGVYQDVLTASNGCDSTVNLNLTVYPIPITNLTEVVCFGDSYTVGNSTYTTTGTYQDILTAFTGCDSIVNLNLTVRNLIETNLTETVCFGDSYTVGNSNYTASGAYQDVLTAVNGCDSIVNLNLTVRNLIETSLVETICEGDSWPVGTSIYNTTGIYQDVLTSVLTGCDSIVNLDLTVVPTQYTTLTEAICNGETFTVGTSNYTTSGTYQNTLAATSGCDSVVTLNLTVYPIPQTNLVESICDGETFTVGTSDYTISGNYRDTLTSVVTGCDSIVSLNLTVIPIPVITLTEEICDGDSFPVGTSVYDASGQYQDVLVAASGCDSIVNLNLTVSPVYAISLTELICDDETFTVGNTNFNTTGTFIVPLQSVSGCDSTVTLNLTTHPCELSFSTLANAARCNGNADGSYQFAVTVGTAPYTYSWQGLGGNPLNGSGNIAANNANALINNLQAGNYRITITDSYGIVGTLNFAIAQPPVLNASIALSDYENFNISCAGGNDGSATASAVGGTTPYNYAWNTGLNSATIEDLTANTYTVTVTDQNGCTTTTQAALTAPEPLNVAAEVTDPLCFGDLEGFINVSTVSGGVGPFVYALNNGPFTVSSVFGNLGIGTYAIQVQDANGCETEITETVHQPQELIVDLGPDVQISLGDSIRLPAETTYPVASYIWKIDPALSCADCYDPMVRPFETAAFSVVVTDENGCTDSDAITVFVAKNREVFIPNVFSPNGDGFNDVLYIQAGAEVARIRAFKVFNRWGEELIQLDNFQPNDPAYGWDGTHRGQLMNAAVFVYVAEVEFIDGEIRLFKGDVVLMR